MDLDAVRDLRGVSQADHVTLLLVSRRPCRRPLLLACCLGFILVPYPVIAYLVTDQAGLEIGRATCM